MQVLINSDASIDANQALKQRIEASVRSGLDRFTEHLSRAEIHLSDVNSESKTGDRDMQCTLEVRLRGHDPLAVHHQAPSIDLAAKGAIEKAARALSNLRGKLAARTHTRAQPELDPSPSTSPEPPAES